MNIGILNFRNWPCGIMIIRNIKLQSIKLSELNIRNWTFGIMNIRYNELSEQWTFGIFLPPYFLKIGPSDNRALTNKFSDNRAFWQSGFWQTGYLTIGPSDNKADTTGLERKISRFRKVRIFDPIRDFFIAQFPWKF